MNLHSESKPVTKVGFVGLGGWGRQIAARVVRCSDLDIVACYDVQPELRKRFSVEFGGSTCETYEQMLSTPGLDAVFNATANHVHSQTVIAAAEHGLHVFVEKPIANTVAEAQLMIDACEQAAVVLFVGHCHRRHPVFRTMKEIIDSDEIGRPIMVEANVSHGGGRNMPPEHWRCSRETCPATPMMQLGVHAIDTMHYLLGPSVAASGMLAHLSAPS